MYSFYLKWDDGLMHCYGCRFEENITIDFNMCMKWTKGSAPGQEDRSGPSPTMVINTKLFKLHEK